MTENLFRYLSKWVAFRLNKLFQSFRTASSSSDITIPTTQSVFMIIEDCVTIFLPIINKYS